jgi:hypothetical protein
VFLIHLESSTTAGGVAGVGQVGVQLPQGSDMQGELLHQTRRGCRPHSQL